MLSFEFRYLFCIITWTLKLFSSNLKLLYIVWSCKQPSYANSGFLFMQKNFTTTFTSTLGMCWTFQTELYQTKRGTQHGLLLLLDVLQVRILYTLATFIDVFVWSCPKSFSNGFVASKILAHLILKKELILNWPIKIMLIMTSFDHLLLKKLSGGLFWRISKTKKSRCWYCGSGPRWIWACHAWYKRINCRSRIVGIHFNASTTSKDLKFFLLWLLKTNLEIEKLPLAAPL